MAFTPQTAVKRSTKTRPQARPQLQASTNQKPSPGAATQHLPGPTADARSRGRWALWRARAGKSQRVRAMLRPFHGKI